MLILISAILLSTFSFGRIDPHSMTKYNFSSPECSSLYLPFGPNINDLVRPEVENKFAYVSSENKKIRIQFSSNSRSTNSKTYTAEFKQKYFSDSYETKMVDGNLFFNGRYYKWQISRISSYEIQIESYSKVVFLGLPTISNTTCILSEAF
jgi:hypothetical protein